MRKRILSLFLISLLLVSLCSCSSVKDGISKMKIRNNLHIGLLIMQGENNEPADSLKTVAKDIGIKQRRVETRQDVTPENAYSELCLMAENGCNLIFAIGEIPEDFVVQAATDYPETDFFSIDSLFSENSGATNLRNAFFDETQLRYVSGVAAGYKLREMIESEQITADEAKAGFVASFPDSEAISAYTAFYLGVKSVCESAVASVQYTYDYGNTDSEKRAVRALISNGCVIISQQSDSELPTEICQRNGVYYIGKNNTTSDVCVATIKRDYSDVFRTVIERIINEDSSPFVCVDYSDTDASLIEINPESFGDKNLLYEAQIKIKETEKAFADETLNVFDVSEWTVNGEQIKTTVGEEFEKDYQNTEYINQGYFSEYEFSAVPKFAFIIDGITQMNADNTEEDLL